MKVCYLKNGNYFDEEVDVNAVPEGRNFVQTEAPILRENEVARWWGYWAISTDTSIQPIPEKVPKPQLKSTFSPLEWEMRFQDDEMWAMAEVAKLDRTAFKLMRQMDRAGDFNIADPRTIDGLNYVATLYDADGGEPYSLLPSPARIAELLTPDAIDQ